MDIAHVDFDNNIKTDFFNHLEQYTTDFFNSLPKKKGFNNTHQVEPNVKNFLKVDNPATFQETLGFIQSCLDNSGIQAASGNHCGYIPGGGLFENAIGNFISSIGNYFSGVSFASPVAVQLEQEVINWACRLVGYSPNANGNITSGGSIANLTALSVAKKAKDISSKNVLQCCIYMGEHTHHSIRKALHITGLYEANIRVISLNDKLEIDIDKLKQSIEQDLSENLIPSIVISSAGTTNAGVIDDLSKISQIAQEHGIWHHCDAAYGGFFVLSNLANPFLKNITASDSITLDPHKALFQSYGSGMILIKKGAELANAFSEKADYMRDTIEANLAPSDLSIELSRPFRALPLWLSLKLHGQNKFALALDEKLQLTQFVYRRLEQLGFIVGPKPKLSVMLFRTHSNSLTEKLNIDIQEHCPVFLSSTESSTHIWIRIAIVSHRTSEIEIKSLLSFLDDWKSKKYN